MAYLLRQFHASPLNFHAENVASHNGLVLVLNSAVINGSGASNFPFIYLPAHSKSSVALGRKE